MCWYVRVLSDLYQCYIGEKFVNVKRKKFWKEQINKFVGQCLTGLHLMDMCGNFVNAYCNVSWICLIFFDLSENVLLDATHAHTTSSVASLLAATLYIKEILIGTTSSGISYQLRDIICERERALYGIKCVLGIFWQTWMHILMNKKKSALCKHRFRVTH